MSPFCFLERALPSLQPFSGTWQVSQDIEPSLERRLSKKSCLPRATFSALWGLSAGVFSSGRGFGVGARGAAAGIGGRGLAAALWDAAALGGAEAWVFALVAPGVDWG